MITYEDIVLALDTFIQEFKKDIKTNHDLIINHINNNSTAHTASNITLPEGNYSDRYESSNITKATNNLLEKLIFLSGENYVHPASHSADMIDTNTGRRFVSDVQLETFANKVDKEYLNETLQQFTKEQRKLIDNKLGNIINMRKVTNNLEAVNALLDSDATLSKLIELVTSRVSEEQLEDHTNNIIQHMSEEDRNNLNILAKLINCGGYDWNAESGAINYIKNKPDKLPADGGDATTIEGRGINTLLNGRRTSTIIIGSKKYGFNKDNVDYVCDGENDGYIIQKAINDLINNRNIGGEIYLREGTYNISENIIIKPIHTDQNIIITGCGNASILNFVNADANQLIIGDNVEVVRININKSIIKINSNSEINDSKITYSDIIFDNANVSALSNSDINFSSLKLSGSCINNMISNNRFIKSTLPTFNGDNYINNNFKFV